MKPDVIYIETTNLCNAACIMCPHDKIHRMPHIMPEEIFQKALTDCRNLDITGGQIFLHKEGEPLLDPSIIPRVKQAVQMLGRDNEIGLNTNAMLLTEAYTEGLLDAGLNLIFFSVDGASKEEYEKIRIRLDYDIVVHQIRYFLEQCQRRRAPIRVVMQMLVQSPDQDTQAFIDMWKNYPCEFYIKEMHGYLDGGHSSQTTMLSARQIEICKDPFHIAVIYTNGNVGLCCWDYNNEYSIGNIMEFNLSQLWNNASAQKLRSAMLKKECSSIIPCSRCARVFGRDYISTYAKEHENAE